jgi:glutamate/tyrosine decarboxylase-like PLP-dependent enzyme
VLAGEKAHSTLPRALRLIGLGAGLARAGRCRRAGADASRRPGEALAAAEGPAIVCAQAGEVNTGSFDPLAEIADAAAAAGAWLHVDGAFGLWAAASPRFAHLVAGAERADSWSTDAHKWLNVPYDSGIALCARPEAHRRAMSVYRDYLVQAGESGPARPDGLDTGVLPPRPRVHRLRGDPIARPGRDRRAGRALLRSRAAVRRRHRSVPGAEVLNDVVLNQVLFRFESDERTQAKLAGVQRSGVAWMSGSVWAGRQAIRISVSNWQTTEEDIDRTVEAFREAS